MKKLLAIILVLVTVLTLGACGASSKDGKKEKEEGKESISMSNENVTVEGVYVDSSYTDKDSAALKMVYVFVSVKATDENLKVDSSYTKFTVNESNSYDSIFYKDSCKYMPSYYYSSFIEDVYVGNDIKVALTFKIPEGDLKDSKTIVLTDSSMPFDDIEFTTDEIVFCNSPEEIGEKADPEGYAEMMDKFSPVDAETEKMVKDQINGYYWTFYVSAGTTVQKREIEFSAPNNFEVRASFATNGGTYEITKGYIRVTYPTNNATYDIPYEFVDGEINLDCATAFSIYE